jgi:hypothetical protein
MGRDEMRAGDGDRKAVADRLKTALDEGRLDLSEYDERLQKTYAAKTFGDLNGLLDDLPGTMPVQHSQVQAYQTPIAPAAGPVPAEEHDSHRMAWLAPGMGLFLVCTLVWLFGGMGYFWPVWTLIPFVFGLLGTLSGGGSGNRQRNRDRNRRRDR